MVNPLIVAATVAALAWAGIGNALAQESSSSSSSYSKTTLVQSSSTTAEAGSNGRSSKSTSGSSSEVVEQSGVMGFRHANKFVPKYKERISTYHHQMELGLSKGWLSRQDAEHFGKELERLTALEATVSGAGWQKQDVDDLDKQFTKFNKDFTDAAQKKPVTAPAITAAPPAPAASTPKVAAPAAKTTTALTARKPAAAAKPAAKPAAKKK